MITPIFTAIGGLMLVYLSLATIKARRAQKVALGDSHSIELTKWIRAQGNFAEYTPLVLMLLFIAEYLGTSTLEIAVIGLLFFAGRIAHFYSLTKHEQYENGTLQTMPKFRILGMQLTFLSIMYLSVRILISYAL